MATRVSYSPESPIIFPISKPKTSPTSSYADIVRGYQQEIANLKLINKKLEDQLKEPDRTNISLRKLCKKLTEEKSQLSDQVLCLKTQIEETSGMIELEKITAAENRELDIKLKDLTSQLKDSENDRKNLSIRLAEIEEKYSSLHVKYQRARSKASAFAHREQNQSTPTEIDDGSFPFLRRCATESFFTFIPDEASHPHNKKLQSNVQNLNTEIETLKEKLRLSEEAHKNDNSMYIKVLRKLDRKIKKQNEIISSLKKQVESTNIIRFEPRKSTTLIPIQERIANDPDEEEDGNKPILLHYPTREKFSLDGFEGIINSEVSADQSETLDNLSLSETEENYDLLKSDESPHERDKRNLSSSSPK